MFRFALPLALLAGCAATSPETRVDDPLPEDAKMGLDYYVSGGGVVLLEARFAREVPRELAGFIMAEDLCIGTLGGTPEEISGMPFEDGELGVLVICAEVPQIETASDRIDAWEPGDGVQ
ncbi:hypothetical protein ACMA5I_13780 [Paracoccaceae bacterium GXU_MW_L88]